MIRIAVGVIVLLTVAAPALAGDAARYSARTLLFEAEERGLHADDPVRMAGAYIGPTLSPICKGGTRTSCWLEFENQPDCHMWNPTPEPNETVTWSADCVDGKASGRGRLVWRYGGDSLTYVGDMKAGEFHGSATTEWSDGARYVGEWRDGQFNGRGTLVWGRSSPHTGDRYEGEWRNGNRHGRGTYTYVNGDTWTCQWRDNVDVRGTCKKH